MKTLIGAAEPPEQPKRPIYWNWTPLNFTAPASTYLVVTIGSTSVTTYNT